MSQVGAALGTRARSLFDRLFPDRQIIHRSCGAVRALHLSPGKQALAALGAVGFAGWCVYVSATTLLAGPQPAAVVNFETERAKYQRWLDDFHGRAAAARARLEEETRRFEEAQRALRDRHAVLRALVEYAHGSGLRPPRSEPVAIAAMTQEEPAVRAEENITVRLASLRARLGTVLGPREAAALPLESFASATPDFVASVRDPDFAARVRIVSERVAASRRFAP